MRTVELHTMEVDIVLCIWTCTVKGKKSRGVEEEGQVTKDLVCHASMTKSLLELEEAHSPPK